MTMPEFEYEATDADSNSFTGQISADSVADAVATLSGPLLVLAGAGSSAISC